VSYNGCHDGASGEGEEGEDELEDQFSGGSGQHTSISEHLLHPVHPTSEKDHPERHKQNLLTIKCMHYGCMERFVTKFYDFFPRNTFFVIS